MIFSYPIISTFINTLTDWSTANGILSGIGVPKYAENNIYNIYLFSFWLSTGPTDIALLWEKIDTYIGNNTEFGIGA